MLKLTDVNHQILLIVKLTRAKMLHVCRTKDAMLYPKNVSAIMDIQRTLTIYAHLLSSLRQHLTFVLEGTQEITPTLRDVMASFLAVTEYCIEGIAQQDYGMMLKLIDVNHQILLIAKLTRAKMLSVYQTKDVMLNPKSVSAIMDIQKLVTIYVHLLSSLRQHLISVLEGAQENTPTLRDVMASFLAVMEYCIKWIAQQDYGMMLKLIDVNGQILLIVKLTRAKMLSVYQTKDAMLYPKSVSAIMDIQKIVTIYVHLLSSLRQHLISVLEGAQENTPTLRDVMASFLAVMEYCIKWIAQQDYGMMLKLIDVNGH